MAGSHHFVGLMLSSLLVLSACGGGGGSNSPLPAPSGSGGTTTPPPVPPPPPPPPEKASVLETESEAARFLIQAGFGGSRDDVNDLVGVDAADWLNLEFNKPAQSYLDPILSEYRTNGEVPWNTHSDLYWSRLFHSDDVLRQRMIYALSQIFVISDDQVDDRELAVSYFKQILSNNAFGNFRDLLQDVTYSPAMADFLTYLRNKKGDPESGRVPDENYARELLQLFTIGLVELNMDGTPKASQAETYDNDDIRGLARVFTGLSLQGEHFWSRDGESFTRPLQMFEDKHSELEKSFLGTTIPANTPGDESVSLALDTIFEHPNVPPFIARQLIQRFTASHPAPAYVERVATAFADGLYVTEDGIIFGEGRRGDLKATIAAILLDDTIHDDALIADEASGKIKEPVIKFAQWNRTFNVSAANLEDEWRLNHTASPSDRLSQHPFRAPSVFNFYRPGYSAPGTEAGDMGLTTPEFQVVNEGASLGYVNFMTDFIFDATGGSDTPERFTPDYTYEISLSDDPASLVDHLNLVLTADQMNQTEIDQVVQILSDLTVEDDDDRRARAEVGILLISSLPSYSVLK